MPLPSTVPGAIVRQLGSTASTNGGVPEVIADSIRRFLTLKWLLVTVAVVVVWIAVYALSHFAAVLLLVGAVMALPMFVLRTTRDIQLHGAGSRFRDDPNDWPDEWKPPPGP
jgi:uncharacterized membrane protein